jgi:hypothetical protein
MHKAEAICEIFLAQFAGKNRSPAHRQERPLTARSGARSNAEGFRSLSGGRIEPQSGVGLNYAQFVWPPINFQRRVPEGNGVCASGYLRRVTASSEIRQPTAGSRTKIVTKISSEPYFVKHPGRG